jgi:hypothetical protein
MPTRRPTSRPRIPTAPARADSSTLALIATILFTLVLRCATLLGASNWWWGLDAFRPWPLSRGIALAALAALGFVPLVARAIESALERVASVWERGNRAADGAVSLLGAALIFALRDPIHYAGDALVRFGSVKRPASELPQVLAHVYPADRWINFTLPHALWRAGMSDADAVQLVGAAIAGLFVFVGCRFLRASGARGSALPVAALALFGGAGLIHLAGYDKFGPLMLGLALASLGATRLAREGRGAWTLAAGVALAALAHRSAYLLVPALAWVVWKAYRTAPDRRARTRLLIAGLAMGVALLAMLPRSADLILHFDRSVHLPGGDVARARAGTSRADPLTRLVNGVNVLSFLTPLWWIGLAAAVVAARAPGRAERAPRSKAGFTIAPAAGLALGAFAILPFGIEPGGGWVRDWDVATGVGTLLACATAYALIAVHDRPGARRIEGPVTTLALATGIALWGLHADPAAATRRIESLLRASPPWSAATRAQTYDFLGVRALNDGRNETASSDFESAIALGGPNPRLVYQAGIAHFRSGHLREARARFVQMQAQNPTNARPWLVIASVDVARRDTASALACLDSALARDAREPYALAMRSAILTARSAPR